MSEHAVERKRGVDIPAESSLLLPGFPFPFMLNAHGNIFFLQGILFAFLFFFFSPRKIIYRLYKLYTECLTLKTRLKEHICATRTRTGN